jgi:hypothetical protein
LGDTAGFLLIRYLQDGSIDSSFGDSGFVVTDFDFFTRQMLSYHWLFSLMVK